MVSALIRPHNHGSVRGFVDQPVVTISPCALRRETTATLAKMKRTHACTTKRLQKRGIDKRPHEKRRTTQERIRESQEIWVNRTKGKGRTSIPERTRTSNLRLRRPTLYPVELRGQFPGELRGQFPTELRGQFPRRCTLHYTLPPSSDKGLRATGQVLGMPFRLRNDDGRCSRLCPVSSRPRLLPTGERWLRRRAFRGVGGKR